MTTKFTYKKLPRYFEYVPSKKDIRELINTIEATILWVDFSGSMYSDTHDRKAEQDPKNRHFIHMGIIEARLRRGEWIFRLSFDGIRKKTTGIYRDQVRAKILNEIRTYIQDQQQNNPEMEHKPRAITLAIDIHDGLVSMNCMRHDKPESTYHFQSNWWRTME